jgi:hypothetical protein
MSKPTEFYSDMLRRRRMQASQESKLKKNTEEAKVQTNLKRLGRTAKEVGMFTLGLPLGFISGAIPLVGIGVAILAVDGYLSSDLRNKGESTDRYNDRMRENKKSESLARGAMTGVVIGSIGQLAAYAVLAS